MTDCLKLTNHQERSYRSDQENDGDKAGCHPRRTLNRDNHKRIYELNEQEMPRRRGREAEKEGEKEEDESEKEEEKEERRSPTDCIFITLPLGGRLIE